MKNLKSGVFVRGITVFALFLVVTGCSLISVDRIRNATRNDVVNLGDSVYALSGKIQNNLHSWAGQTFRRYALSGSMVSHIAD
ncbi:MAG TPA: hypothetical protein PK600_04195, partial [Deltaproteobacteria bacterium]|nr:hypothetical protein [Deltaproteobacteria bacterium]